MTSDRTPDPQTSQSKLIQQLRDEPRTYTELPYPPKPHHREYVAKINIPSSKGKTRGSTKTVYYLYGDDRRAVRKFINVNNEFVESCMGDSNNPIANRLPDEAWDLFVQEWTWMGGDV